MTLTIGPSANLFGVSAAGLREPGHARLCRSLAIGFTLLELVLVMVIICTLLGITAPSLKGFFAGRRTVDAAAQIVALANFARSQSVAEGRVYRLNIDMETGDYWLTAEDGGVFCELGSEFGRIFCLPEGTSFSFDTPSEKAEYFQFHPTGRSETAIIRLIDRKGKEISIACLSPTEMFQVTAGTEDEY